MAPGTAPSLLYRAWCARLPNPARGDDQWKYARKSLAPTAFGHQDRMPF